MCIKSQTFTQTSYSVFLQVLNGKKNHHSCINQWTLNHFAGGGTGSTRRCTHGTWSGRQTRGSRGSWRAWRNTWMWPTSSWRDNTPRRRSVKPILFPFNKMFSFQSTSNIIHLIPPTPHPPLSKEKDNHNSLFI